MVRLRHRDMALATEVAVDALARLEDWVRRNTHLGMPVAFLAARDPVLVDLQFALYFSFCTSSHLFLRSVVVLLFPD